MLMLGASVEISSRDIPGGLFLPGSNSLGEKTGSVSQYWPFILIRKVA